MDILFAQLEGDIADLGKAIAFGVGVGLGAVGAGIGIGNIFGSMIQAVARQPELRGELTGIQWLGFALTEAVVFYALLGGLLAYVLVCDARSARLRPGGGRRRRPDLGRPRPDDLDDRHVRDRPLRPPPARVRPHPGAHRRAARPDPRRRSTRPTRPARRPGSSASSRSRSARRRRPSASASSRRAASRASSSSRRPASRRRRISSAGSTRTARRSRPRT